MVSLGSSELRVSNPSDLRALANARNPDTLDRTRGTATGGVSADRIGFSRELTLPQRRQLERQVGEPGGVSDSRYTSTYGPDGRMSKAPAMTAEGTVSSSLIESAGIRVSAASDPAQPSVTTANPSISAAPVSAPVERVRRTEIVDRPPTESVAPAAPDASSLERTQQRTERAAAAMKQAERVGEAQNVERPPPGRGENDVVRQRLAMAYQPVPMAAAAKLSVFA